MKPFQFKKKIENIWIEHLKFVATSIQNVIMLNYTLQK